MKSTTKRVIIEHIYPEINGGLFPIKRVLDEDVRVEADIICDGHDKLSAEVIYRFKDDEDWSTSEMKPLVNDRWRSKFKVSKLGVYEYSIRAWADPIKSWYSDILKRIEADTDYESDLLVGAELIREVVNTHQSVTMSDNEYLMNTAELLSKTNLKKEDRIDPIISGKLEQVIKFYPLRKNVVHYPKSLQVWTEPERAEYSSWYEVFPRSTASDESHGDFKTLTDYLPYISDMGFNVLYLPPIHPVGQTKRKGKNGVTIASDDDVGSPWAIGAKEGGHKAINPELGTMDDFEEFLKKASEHHMDVALDVAFQCSPDHPYIKEHPEWFKHRPDGTLQYAENPPKKYEDIYPINFETEDHDGLWEELKSVFDFWISKGVKVFRVDNPHTKSMHFWEWAIHEIKAEHPEVIFLSEAFTRPKVMQMLAKKGFTQSYTYFTWRNTKWELESYLKSINETEVKEYFRPNLWPNTPDILPEFLQYSGRPGYIIRLILAATLSSSYGMYGPAFELMDSTPKEPGKEEYLNSEKFEIKNWDIHRNDSLRSIIKVVNRIRSQNPALQRNKNLHFHHIENENIICYSKHTDDKSNIILTTVNLDPHHTHSGMVQIPLEYFGLSRDTPYQVHDLLAGTYYLWNGDHNYIEINPGIMPAHIFKIRRKVHTERDFDYFM